jgi:2-amino-4-hydroxy-6-hydroxymethyldihydropteridine diphosphokinase
MPVTAYIALGSNLGDRAQHLDQALQFLGQSPGVAVAKVSSYHETDPVGGPAGQGKFLNAAAELRTTLEADELLRLLLEIESKLGRVRHERHGPRTVDLDLLLFDLEVKAASFDSFDLIVPHPRMQERLFVLEPLAEIAPFAVHPGLGSTIQDLLRRLHGAKDRELLGLRAMVTGSTSGIGRAIALELARGGADVIVHGRRSEQQAHAVSAELVRERVRSSVVMADLKEESDCSQLAESGWVCFDGLDIWINNAGTDTLTGAAAHWTFEKKLAELWAVDVRATMQLSRTVGQWMRQRGHGVIINMGWDQAETGMAGDGGELFAAVKGAVMAFSKSLALSLAPEVRVLCLAPGWIRTAWGGQASQAWQQRVLSETPLGRWGTPEDVAQAVRWLVSPAAAFQTGQIVRINGGAVTG